MEKKKEKETVRAQGRKIPQAGEADHERGLMTVATKGVVQLFNSVAEYQTNEQRQVREEIKLKNKKFSDMVKQTGEGMYANTSNQSIVAKLQAKQSRWKVLNPEEDQESDVDSDGNIKIAELDALDAAEEELEAE